MGEIYYARNTLRIIRDLVERRCVQVLRSVEDKFKGAHGGGRIAFRDTKKGI